MLSPQVLFLAHKPFGGRALPGSAEEEGKIGTELEPDLESRFGGIEAPVTVQKCN